MRRKITAELEKFFASDEKKAFLLKGARQVGKTYAIEDFIFSHYDVTQTIKINFLSQPEARYFFESDSGSFASLDPDTIFDRITTNPNFRNVRLIPGKKIAIFLDEIQECPKAITSLKFFALNRKKYDVYASGSYLGFSFLNMSEGDSFPTGYTITKTLNGLDFEEFLWAVGFDENYTANLKKSIAKGAYFDDATHEKLLDLFHKYLVVGSLPAPIKSFLETKDLNHVREILKDLHDDYCLEMNKHLLTFSRSHTGETYSKIMAIKNKAVFDSIPSQLRQQNKKFMYRRVAKGGRERMYIDNILWLKTAGLIEEVPNVKSLTSFLDDYVIEDDFKLFCFDTGILLSQFDMEISNDILANRGDGNYAVSLCIGGIYENAVSNILSKYLCDDKNFYFYKDDKYELDFVYQDGHNIALIEVKSGNDLKAKSLAALSSERNDVIPMRISQKQVKEKTFNEYSFYSFALLYSK